MISTTADRTANQTQKRTANNMHIPTRANNPDYKTLNYWITWDRELAIENTFDLTLFEDAENETTIDGELIENTLDHDYGNFTMYKCESYAQFIAEWERFRGVHMHDFERMYTALYKNYDPLENYDKHSLIVDDGETGAPSSAPLISLGYQVADDTVNSQTPYIPENKAETYGKTEIDNERTEYTHGNIGVTKSTDMLRDEVETRINYNFITALCRMFADEELI